VGDKYHRLVPLIRLFIAASAFSRNRASPTLSTSSINRISTWVFSAVVKPSRASMPEE